MSDIPSELFAEILSRIPTQPLLQFRSVCKSWRSIIDDPSFIKSHRHRHRFSTTGFDPLILRSSETTKLYFLPLDSLRGPTNVTVVNRPQFCRPGLPRLCPFPAPSCDGMILVTHSKVEKAWAVWNPLNGDFLALPPCRSDVKDTKLGLRMLSGIGYDFVTDEYKVVRILQFDGSHGLETMVYSLKSGFWRSVVDRSGLGARSYFSSTGVCADGALYWRIGVKHEEEIVDSIIGFCLGTEAHFMLPFPPAVCEQMKGILCKRLHELSGYLFMTCVDEKHCFFGWKLEDCGGNKSWIKMFSCTMQQFGGSFGTLTPLAYLESEGQVLIQHYGNEFYWVHVRSTSVRKASVFENSDFSLWDTSFTSQVCRPTLFRLSNCPNVGGNGGSKRTASAKKNTAGKRLKFIVDYGI